jgi:hypothetical protein
VVLPPPVEVVVDCAVVVVVPGCPLVDVVDWTLVVVDCAPVVVVPWALVDVVDWTLVVVDA